MKKQKRILSLALALVMALALLPTAALAADITVTEVVPCKYDSVRDFSEGLAAVKLDGKYGFVDKNGNEVAPPKYDDVRDFSEGLAVVCVGKYPDEKRGFVDKTGKEVVPLGKYTSVADFSEGLAAVELDDKWGFIDTTGKEVVSCKYTASALFAPVFHEGLAAVKMDGKWGFIDTTGKEVVSCKYNEAKGFSDGLAAVRVDSGEKNKWGGPVYKWGFIDTTGKEVVSCKYDEAKDFSDGLAAVCVGNIHIDGKWGFVDKNGNEVAPCKYDYVEDFSEGLVAVQLDDKWGFVDKTGKEVVPCKYYSASDFSEGLAAVQGENYKWGYIDKTGKEVIPIGKLTNVGDFHNGMAMASDESEYRVGGYIDKTGKVVVPLDTYWFDGLTDFSEGLAAVNGDSGEKDEEGSPIYKYGFIDTTGKEVVPCTLECIHVYELHDGLAKVWGYDGSGFISVSGAATPITNTAYASTQTVNVDGKAVTFECYALKDANGNATNYIKLRDLAMLLNGSAAQFQVGWDGAVTITTKTAYTPNGSELSTPYSGDRAYQETNAATKVNGQNADLAAFVLNDDAGGGYTYYQLRDLGQALGFNVGWAADKGIFVETDKPYDANN